MYKFLKILLLSFIFLSTPSITFADTLGERIYEEYEGNTDNASDFIKHMVQLKKEYHEATITDNTDISKMVQSNMLEMFMGVILILVPFLQLAGIILFAWSFKVFFVDDHQREGFINTVISFLIKIVVSIMLLSSGKIVKWYLEVLQPAIKEGDFTKKDLVIYLIDTTSAFFQLIGIIIFIYAIYKFSQKDPQNKGFGQIAKQIAMLVGGVLLININSLVWLILK